MTSKGGGRAWHGEVTVGLVKFSEEKSDSRGGRQGLQSPSEHQALV
jgi:hypothetical protein